MSRGSKFYEKKPCLFPFLFLVATVGSLAAKPYPIGFSIPEVKVVSSIPEKTKDFAFIIPGKPDTYIYNSEADYYLDYQRSYFAVTCRKSGWDCMRHYEILANGCIPYFTDLHLCGPDTLYFLPRELIFEAMNLEGVSYGKIDHSIFPREKYDDILRRLLEHTKNHLTTRKTAEFFLRTIQYSGSGKVLFLSTDPAPDYMRCSLLIGLKEVLGNRVVDDPKIEHIYKSYSKEVGNLYGKGFSYTKIVEDLPVNRENIEERIANKEFDIVIYGSVHRGNRYLSLVRSVYQEDEIFYICGEDAHICDYSGLKNLFLREFEAYRE